MFEVKIVSEFFNLIDILKKQKSVINLPLINCWSKFRWAQAKECRVHIKRERKWVLVGNSLLLYRVAYNIRYQNKKSPRISHQNFYPQIVFEH